MLLRSPIHEERLLALLILVRRVTRADDAVKRVDTGCISLTLTYARSTGTRQHASAREIVGGYLANKSRKPLDRLATSRS